MNEIKGLCPEGVKEDGVHAMVSRSVMEESARKLRDIYAITPGVPFLKCEFGFYSLERWREQGLAEGQDLAELFWFEPPGHYSLGQLGWCEAAFCPRFDVRIIEDRGEHEIEQDHAGRHVLYFKGRRNGFMPEYVAHPVKDWRTWEEDVKWRMEPASAERYTELEARMTLARGEASRGMVIVQNLIGGYMYLRSLMGPADLLCMFCEQPDLVHDCMEMWFRLADAVIARHQEYVSLDEVYLAEDICYNRGALISPEMMREFLFPYYQQLLTNVRARQLDPSRHVFLHIDTDGYAPAVIPLYRELGMDVMCPFEVASGCDVVAVGREYPELVLTGGIDKRILAAGKAEIDRHVERILPAMRERGGYFPTCDHGVPEEVTLENYLHYRKRCIELGG